MLMQLSPGHSAEIWGAIDYAVEPPQALKRLFE